MDTQLTVVERHKDGRLYPPGHLRSPEELAKILDLVHKLRCHDHKSMREITQLLGSWGYRVSLGSVHHYVHDFACPRCEDAPWQPGSDSPAPSDRPPAAATRPDRPLPAPEAPAEPQEPRRPNARPWFGAPAAGGLTGQLDRLRGHQAGEPW